MSSLEEAQLEMEDKLRKAAAEYEAKVADEERAKNEMLKQRQQFWSKAMKSKADGQATLASEKIGFEALVKHLQVKHGKAMQRIETKVESMDYKMEETACRHWLEMKAMVSELDHQKERVHEKRRHRMATEQKAQDIKKECVDHVKAMDLWLHANEGAPPRVVSSN